MTQNDITILVISTSQGWQEVLEQWPEKHAQVISFPDINKIEGLQPEVILLDVSHDKLEISIAALKHHLPNIPVVVLSTTQPALPEQYIMLHKPVQANALFERITASLLMQEAPLQLGKLLFFKRRKYLSLYKHPVSEEGKLKLTEKEADILLFLYEQSGRPVDKETLLEQVWGYGEGIDTHTLETHVYRLRQKIADYFDGAEVIANREGGYAIRQ